MRQCSQLGREDVCEMFQFANLRDTRVWQEAYEECVQEGRALARKSIASNLLAMGVSAKLIAQAMEISVAQLKLLVKDAIK